MKKYQDMALTQTLSMYPKSMTQLLSLLRIRCQCHRTIPTVTSARFKDLNDRIWMSHRQQYVTWRRDVVARNSHRLKHNGLIGRSKNLDTTLKYGLEGGNVNDISIRLFHATTRSYGKQGSDDTNEPKDKKSSRKAHSDTDAKSPDPPDKKQVKETFESSNNELIKDKNNQRASSHGMEDIKDEQNNIDTGQDNTKSDSEKPKTPEDEVANSGSNTHTETNAIAKTDTSTIEESGSNTKIDSTGQAGSSETLEKVVASGTRTNLSQKITSFLSENDLPFNDSYTGYYVVCPRFGKMAMKRKKDEQKIYINSLSGNFKCNACGKTGDWNQLSDNISEILVHKRKKGKKKPLGECFYDENESDTTVNKERELNRLQKTLDEARDLASVETEEFENILSLFDWQGMNKKTFSRYGVKYIHQDNQYRVYFPLVLPCKTLAGARVYTAVITEEEDVKLEKVVTIPRSSESCIFGWQTKPEPVTKNYYKELVITTGEIQAMALSQDRETTVTALALRGHFQEEHVPMLEKFEKIYLWFGTDPKALDMAKLVAKRLNEKRCSVIRHDNKMPIESVQSNESVKSKLQMAQPLSHEAILSFDHLRLEVFNEFYHHEHATGVKWKRFYKLNDILKGFRQGELTVLTGPTGSGKTTLLCEYSLDLCMQGVKTLWGSFEISNVRLIKMMMQQLSGKNLVNHLQDFDEVSERFKELPMHFMAYHGEQSTDKVIETMSHAVYVHNIQHVILDNLQFMVGLNQFSDRIDNIFLKQDKIVSQFRKFATDHNCHVTLIIHPRKIDTGEELSISSIFGSAKVSQESDNILLIQDNRLKKQGGRKYLQIVKNRFNGDLGVMTLTFDKDSLSFTMNQKK